jgi:hypothetical protein
VAVPSPRLPRKPVKLDAMRVSSVPLGDRQALKKELVVVWINFPRIDDRRR